MKARRLRVPKTLVIRGQTWRVQLHDPGTLKDDDGNHAFGYCDTDARVIKLERSDDPETVEDTFIHELLHACFHTTSIVRESTEEKIVRAVTPPLMEAMKQLRWANVTVDEG